MRGVHFGSGNRRGSVMNSGKGDGRCRSWCRLGSQQPVWLPGMLFVSLILAAVLLGVWPGALPSAQAQSWQNEESGAVRHIVVTLNKSRTLRFGKPFATPVGG